MVNDFASHQFLYGPIWVAKGHKAFYNGIFSPQEASSAQNVF